MAEFTVAGVCYNKYEAELAGKLRDAVNVWGREKHVMQTWYIADDDNPDPAFLRRVQGPVREWMADRFEDTDVIICICPVVPIPEAANVASRQKYALSSQDT